MIIPARPFEGGKRRLRGVLTDAERAALNRDFFDHVLGVAAAAVGVGRCVIASASAEVRALAVSRGAVAVADPVEGDLNSALLAGARLATARGAEAVLSLSCDLPRLAAADVAALIEASRDAAVVIAPDAAGDGTNALLLTPPGAIAYRYGTRSFSAHGAAAARAGHAPAVVRRPGLAHDVDTPADLAAWRGQPAPG